MTTALLADDEPQLLEELAQLLAEAWPELTIVGRARNGSDARRLLDALQPDIAFLDIRMPGIDGLALARLAPAQTRLVFVTAHAEHALDAFEHAAVDYLHKPVTPARLAATVQRLQAATAAGGPTRLRFLQAWTGNTMKLLEVEQLAALRSELRHTRALSQGASSCCCACRWASCSNSSTRHSSGRSIAAASSMPAPSSASSGATTASCGCGCAAWTSPCP